MRCLPAPSAAATCPTAAASTAASQPSAGASTTLESGAVGSIERSSTTAASPPCAATPSLGAGRDARQHRELRRQRQAEVEEPAATLATEGLDRLADLHRVADQVAQRLSHVADDRGRPPARRGPEVH